MRINVYSQELTKETYLVEKTDANTGVTFWGVRVMLASPKVLHHTPTDDDRSAVTFWIPNANHFTAVSLAEVFEVMADLARMGPRIL